jgi:Tol biopolymer transport system component
VVAYVQDGDLWIWSEATGQAQILIDIGDVIRVELSDDGELAAFVRQSGSNERSALWVVGRDGSSPRELVSEAEVRSNVDAAETESTDFTQLEWIPNTHRLLYSPAASSSQGQGGGRQGGVYMVDADGSAHAQLAPAEASAEFVASPDGGHVAMVTPTGLSFYSFEGSRLRRDVLTYPARAGRPFTVTQGRLDAGFERLPDRGSG